ncbi:MAG: hypothetical protein JWQ84_257 [Mucilaginibacter sp.]|jgi:hypothetical protein|nr:hypothetical protein [Mucilaginibacter sp.]
MVNKRYWERVVICKRTARAEKFRQCIINFYSAKLFNVLKLGNKQ